MGKRIGNLACVVQAHSGIGELYMNMENYRKALEIFTKNLELQKEIGERIGICDSLLRIAECFLENKANEQCKKNLLEAKAILGEISVKDVEALFLQTSAKLLAAEGKTAVAEVELKSKNR